MDVNIPLNAAAGAAVLLIGIAVGIMVKAATLLEKCRDALDDLSDSVRDLRIATQGIRFEFADHIRSEDGPPSPPSTRGTQPAGPWPFATAPDG